MKLCLAVTFINVITSSAFRTYEIRGKETILAMVGETISIRCKTDAPIAYCEFIHPNGIRHTFSGETLTAGHCAITIQAAKTDSGKWRCHIGTEGSIGVEIMQYIIVRVVQELAALEKIISAVHGKPVTIECAAIRGLTPLRYCRFEPPNDSPFSINSDVDLTKSILGRYYFPPNKSLDRGDCAVSIWKVKYEDVGIWTCGVGMDDGKGYIDTIELTVEGLYTMSTASATGITFGAITVFLAILGFIVWRKRRFLGSVPTESEGQELRHLRYGGPPRASPHVTPRTSPHVTPRASPHVTPRVIPQGSPHETAVVSRHPTPTAPPQVSVPPTPLATFNLQSRPIPEITLQSPSERGSSFST